MSPPKTIIFGPTGAVGSSAALTAASLGASVVLAMRDISKPIRNLSPSAEAAGPYERVTADLTSPTSVASAVTSTGATRAFIYLAHGSPDHMLSTLHALKASGIELVVFLSSFTVRGSGKEELGRIQPSEVIPYVHARVEMALEEVFAEEGFVALRPGSFASNVLQYKKGWKEGVVYMQGMQRSVDCIVQADIGRVAGRVLVEGPPKGEDGETKRKLYLYGPRVLTQAESVRMVWRAMGRREEELRFVEPSKEEAYRLLVEERGMPEVVARYMSEATDRRLPERKAGGSEWVFVFEVRKEELRNVERYSGRRATGFEEWARENLGLFE